MSKLLSWASLQGEVRIFFFLKAKVNSVKMPTLLKEVFWWLQWLKNPEEGGYIGMLDKQRLTGAESLWLPPCIKWWWFIQVFILIARPPSQLKYIWGQCHGIKGSAQDSGAVTGCQRPVVGTKTGGLSHQQPGCQAQRKERATAAALAGMEQKQALSSPALLDFHHFCLPSAKFP